MTVEAAFAIASIVAVVVVCIGAVVSVLMQIQCIDAAREAARLAARGDEAQSISVAARVAPDGARVSVVEEGALVVATVTVSSPLPGLTLTAEAVAFVEPEVVS